MDRTGQTLRGKYRLVGLLGQGGMGEVWSGVHTRTGRRVAVKLLDTRYLENVGIVQRFGREARAASAIQHPGIVEVLDRDQTDDGVPFIVMEFVEGESLAKRILARGRLSQDETAGILRQLLEALDAAHAHGVVHRDIKPDNVILVPDSRGADTVKILDFGISQKSDEVIAHLTQTGSVLGTPHYMSPEQAMGYTDLDARVDLYSLGVLAYECLVGDVPFDAGNYNALLQHILNSSPRLPHDRGAKVAPAVEKVVMSAMAKNRDERPASARAMLELLDAALRGEAPAVRKPLLAMTPPPGELPAAGARPGWGDLDIPSGTREPTERVAVRAPSPPPPAQPSPPPPAHPSPSPPQGDEDLDAALAGVIPSAALALDWGDDAAGEGPPLPELSDRRPEPRVSVRPVGAGSRHSLPAAGMSSGTLRASRLPAASQLPEPPPSMPVTRSTGSRVVWWVVGGVVLFAAVVVAIRVAVRPGESPPQTTTLPVPIEAPVVARVTDELVSVDVVGLPPRSRVALDGLPVATLPMRLRRGEAHRLEIECPQYDKRVIDFTAGDSNRIVANLVPSMGTTVRVPR